MLKRIRVHSYKSMRSVDLELDSLNVLIGANGAGKSNFLSLFSLLKNVVRGNLQYFGAMEDVNTLFYNGLKESEAFSASFVFDSFAYSFELTASRQGRLFFSHEELEIDGGRKYDLGRGHAESRLSTLSSEPGAGEAFRLLTGENWNVFHFQDTGSRSQKRLDHSSDDDVSLAPDGGNIGSYLYRLKRDSFGYYGEIVQAVRNVSPLFDDFVFDCNGDGNKVALKWRQLGCETVMHASQFSDGLLRYICLVTLFLQPPEMLPSILVLDEPELGLTPYTIAMLGDLIRSTSERTQTLLASHSCSLLNEFAPQDVVVVDQSISGSSFSRLDAEAASLLMDHGYCLSDLWEKGMIGGIPGPAHLQSMRQVKKIHA